jgi:diguanylate cyclase (GGDEF)-like protein
VTETASVRRSFRLARGEREAPRGLLWTAAVYFLLSVLNFVFGEMTVGTALLHLLVCILLCVVAVAVRLRMTPVSAVPWVIAVVALLLVAALQLEVWQNPTTLGMAYVLLAMVGYGTFTLAFPAMLAAAAPMLVGCVVVTVHGSTAWAPAKASDWVFAAIAALAFGAVLLRLRLRAIDELGEMTALAQARATRDPLTDALNRLGLEERLPEVVAHAARQRTTVFVLFVDIDGLKAANDEHGHEFGDGVICAVAEAVRASMRATDLVGRWGGDELIVLGAGRPEPVEVLSGRISRHLEAGLIDLDKWPGGVSLGLALADAEGFDVDAVIARADADMYARRRVTREPGASTAD